MKIHRDFLLALDDRRRMVEPPVEPQRTCSLSSGSDEGGGA
jgi:hypothetical protein